MLSTPDSLVGAAATAGDHGGHAGLDVRLVGQDLLVTSVERDGGAMAAGVRVGWKLLAVGSTDMQQMLRTVGDVGTERLQQLE